MLVLISQSIWNTQQFFSLFVYFFNRFQSMIRKSRILHKRILDSADLFCYREQIVKNDNIDQLIWKNGLDENWKMIGL
ncbi:MAG: hypothetical protein C0403_17195 [Desulfobacterium sp.]|nr:hypothetical protein [Desulfobacterium sp.]